MAINAHLILEAERLGNMAANSGLPLRLLGGVAVYQRCPSAREGPLCRGYKDLDYACLGSHRRAVGELFEEAGYAPHRSFNALHGHERLLFYDQSHNRQVDIFVDRMHLCHVIDLRKRIMIDGMTLPLADLLLSKLQIVQMTAKDAMDIAALLIDHDLSERDAEGINLQYMLSLASGDWGLWRTLNGSLDRVEEFLSGPDLPVREPALGRIHALRQALARSPKSAGWKLRAMVGEKVQWYQLPQEEEMQP